MNYGCNGRKPITTFGATTCQYTLSEIGAFDPKCGGCQEQRKASSVGLPKNASAGINSGNNKGTA